MANIRDWAKKFKADHPTIYSFAKDLAFSLVVVSVIALILYAYSGTWPPEAAVSGVSMLPHLHEGDLVLLQSIDRSPIHTYDASVPINYTTYEGYGDIIVYHPHGDMSAPMVIHRVIRWVNRSETMYVDWHGNEVKAPHSGYITLGDNNDGVYDQEGSVCYNDPVRPEWIHGVVKFRVPYLGYIKEVVSGLLSGYFT
ncbi:MAG TPA: S26 family signal peptidase [Methanocella sp.]|nr:S26 family signal peptidase [Methanocella sp.]